MRITKLYPRENFVQRYGKTRENSTSYLIIALEKQSYTLNITCCNASITQWNKIWVCITQLTVKIIFNFAENPTKNRFIFSDWITIGTSEETSQIDRKRSRSMLGYQTCIYYTWKYIHKIKNLHRCQKHEKTSITYM